VIFQDFPGPGILKEKNPGLSRRRGNPVWRSLRNALLVAGVTFFTSFQLEGG